MKLPRFTRGSLLNAKTKLQKMVNRATWPSETAYRSDGDIATVCPLLSLPPELLLQIVSYLSIIEQICLFMTCKQLYAAYGPIPKPESVQVHRPAAAIPQSFYSYTSVALRWKLLRYLENDRWQA